MIIIARTKKGFLIESTEEEVVSVYRAVSGKKLDTSDSCIGVKLPAFDYASIIERVKTLGTNSHYEYLERRVTEFSKYWDNLQEAIKAVAELSDD